MERRTAIAGGLAAAAVGLVLALRRRRPPSDDERIRELLAAAARAAEERRVGGVVEGVSERFAGGGLDRRGLAQLVTLHVLRGEWVSVSIAGTRVEVAVDSARAAADVVLARSGRGARLADLLPADATVYRLALRLEREDGTWKVVRASWRPVSLQAALDGPLLEPEGP